MDIARARFLVSTPGREALALLEPALGDLDPVRLEAALGTPAKVKGPLAGTPAERWVRANPSGYQALAQRHRAGVAPA